MDTKTEKPLIAMYINDEPKYEDSYFAENNRKLVKFELFGNEIIDKEVRACGNSGRIYLPPDWVGCRVKIVKID